MRITIDIEGQHPICLTVPEVRSIVRVAIGSHNTTDRDFATVYRIGEVLNERVLMGQPAPSLNPLDP